MTQQQRRRLSISAAPYVLVADIDGIERSSDHKTERTALKAWERAIKAGAFSARLSRIDVLTLQRTIIADHREE